VNLFSIERIRARMGAQPPLRDDSKFPTAKIAVFQYLVVGVFVFPITGFWQLQVRNPEFYNEKAERNRIKSLPLPAPRGKILDRDGRVIVDNHSSFSLILSRDSLKPEHVRYISDGLNLDHAVLETRLRQAQAEPMAPIDLISCLVSDELTRRSDRPLERRRKQASFRDPHRTLDNFDFTFNPKINRSLVFDLATGAFIGRREDALFLGPGGTGKSHLAQAIGQAAIQQGYRVLYRETHILLEELAEAVIDGTRKQYVESISTVPLPIIDDFGMRKLPQTAAEDLLEITMRRYERANTLPTSNRPVEDWGKLLGDAAAVGAMLDRLLHHGHLLKCGPRSWRTKTAATAG
jgi:DNA replication protein DnaC